jgi:hypothetical protein
MNALIPGGALCSRGRRKSRYYCRKVKIAVKLTSKRILGTGPDGLTRVIVRSSWSERESILVEASEAEPLVLRRWSEFTRRRSGFHHRGRRPVQQHSRLRGGRSQPIVAERRGEPNRRVFLAVVPSRSNRRCSDSASLPRSTASVRSLRKDGCSLPGPMILPRLGGSNPQIQRT